MALLGRTSDRIGRRPFLAVSAGVFGAGIAGLADGYAALLVALIVLYAASGLYDVGINAAAVDLERSAGRRFMPVLHATFSTSGVTGALSAGALLSWGVDYRYVYLVVLIPLTAVILAVATTRAPSCWPGAEEKETIGCYALYQYSPLLLIAAIAALGLLSEGEMEHWSGIYLRESLALPALLGASGSPSSTPGWLWGVC